jgi:K+-sensing histidine kinase KdpD
VGLVFGGEALLVGLIGHNNGIVIVASTLIVAVLFQPLRHRIQQVIDPGFYRRKYDAAKTLAAFSARLRNEVDLDQLSEELLAVVQETMQPTHVSLWVRKNEQRRKPNTDV